MEIIYIPVAKQYATQSWKNAVRGKSTGKSYIHIVNPHTHTLANTTALVQIQAFQEMVVEGEVHQALEAVAVLQEIQVVGVLLVLQVIQVVGVLLVLPVVEVVGVLLVLPAEQVLGVPEVEVLGVVSVLPVVEVLQKIKVLQVLEEWKVVIVYWVE